MDLSGIIFVALAVAWAAYLVPKALTHHDEVASTRSVDRFSHTMRVLARREPVNHRDARLVVTPQRTGTGPVVTRKPTAQAAPGADPESVPSLTPAQVRARRRAARLAARRRRRVLGLLLLAVAGVATAAGLGALDWVWVSVPAGLVVAWLVLCRVMVRRETGVRRAPAAPVTEAAAPEQDPLDGVPEDYAVARNEQGFDEVTPDAATTTHPATEGMWDPVPTTLPTYVTKAPASRSVRTIDLDSTGVWTSGRTDADAALAREADAERAATSGSETDRARAVGT